MERPGDWHQEVTPDAFRRLPVGSGWHHPDRHPRALSGGRRRLHGGARRDLPPLADTAGVCVADGFGVRVVVERGALEVHDGVGPAPDRSVPALSTGPPMAFAAS